MTWKLVPTEPTEEMLKAIRDAGYDGNELAIRADYKAMLAAAPQPPSEPIYEVWNRTDYPSHWETVDKDEYDREKNPEDKRIIYEHPPKPDTEELEALQKERDKWKRKAELPMKYKRMTFNAELQNQLTRCRAVMEQAVKALERYSDHYECEDTFYSCPAHESAWEERKGECCCGADKANEALTALREALKEE